MTLDEAIKHAEEVAEKNERRAESVRNRPISSADFYHEEESCSKCATEHRQLAEWLKDYKRLKEQEPIDCANAEHDVDGCLGYSTDRGGYSYCQTCLECPKASINNWDKEQETCDDCISREEMWKAYHKMIDSGNTVDVYDAIKNLPSVTPQPKTGRLILLDECSNSGYYCSECQKKVVKEGWSNTVKKIKYCPNCGAKMSEIPTGAEGSEKND